MAGLQERRSLSALDRGWETPLLPHGRQPGDGSGLHGERRLVRERKSAHLVRNSSGRYRAAGELRYQRGWNACPWDISGPAGQSDAEAPRRVPFELLRRTAKACARREEMTSHPLVVSLPVFHS